MKKYKYIIKNKDDEFYSVYYKMIDEKGAALKEFRFVKNGKPIKFSKKRDAKFYAKVLSVLNGGEEFSVENIKKYE